MNKSHLQCLQRFNGNCNVGNHTNKDYFFLLKLSINELCDEACLYPDAHEQSSFKIKDFLIENLLPLAHEPAESSNSFSLCFLGWAPTNNELKFPKDMA